MEKMCWKMFTAFEIWDVLRLSLWDKFWGICLPVSSIHRPYFFFFFLFLTVTFLLHIILCMSLQLWDITAGAGGEKEAQQFCLIIIIMVHSTWGRGTSLSYLQGLLKPNSWIQKAFFPLCVADTLLVLKQHRSLKRYVHFIRNSLQGMMHIVVKQSRFFLKLWQNREEVCRRISTYLFLCCSSSSVGMNLCVSAITFPHDTDVVSLNSLMP